MRRLLLVAAIIALGACSAVNAKHIYLKNTFFGGMKYSIDSIQFQKVGMSGDRLRLEMSDNPDAVNQMNSYKTCKIWATVTGIPGGFLIGWPLGKAIAGNYESSDGTMMLIGAPIAVASTILELVGNSHLSKAVKLYNGELQPQARLFPPVKNPPGTNSPGLGFTLVRF